MKIRFLESLAGGIGAMLILSSHAEAEFINLRIINENSYFDNHPNEDVRQSWKANGKSLNVFRVYAYFDGSTLDDRVNAVFGSDDIGTASLMSNSGAFYNYYHCCGFTHGYGAIYYDLPPVEFSGFVNPVNAWETWATIGPDFGKTNTQFSPGAHEDPSKGNFQNFGHFFESWSTDDAAWFISTDDANGQSIEDHGNPGLYRVLLFQATVRATSENGVFNHITGQFGISVGGVDSPVEMIFDERTFFTTIPAPGPLGMLGALGLFSFRSRRR